MKKRMLAALVGLSVGVLIVHDIPLASYLRKVETDRFVTGLERDSFILVGSAQEAIEEPSSLHKLKLQDDLKEYVANGDATVLVTDQQGLAVAATTTDIVAGDDFSTRPEIQQALDGKVVSGRRYSNTLNYELLYVAVPITRSGQIYGTVRITFPASSVDRTIANRLRILEGAAGITILFAILLALLLSSSITRRLFELQEVTEEFASGNYSVRANTSGGANEIRTLAESFNSMADKLSLLITQQREFVGNASHQLRTPLTALQLRMDRAKSELDTDPTAAAKSLEAAILEMERLKGIVEGLLALSRIEARTSDTPQSFDLSNIVINHVEQWHALANEYGVQIEVKDSHELSVLALPGVIEQVIDNYLDNALNVAPRNSKITISLSEEADHVTLHIVDQGPGLSEEDCERAFYRFWRAKSDEHGSGLGLAIVQSLMEASGGTVRLVNVKPNGIDAQATFKKV